MDREQAEQLAKRIQNEVPQLDAVIELVTWLGGKGWGVRITALSTGFLLGIMESPTQWDELKPQLQKRLPPNS